MKKTFLLFTLLMLLCGYTAFSQAEVTVTENDGNVSVLDVSIYGKVYFSADQMLIDDGYGNVREFAVSDIRKVQFASQPYAIEEFDAQSSLLLYPNPATTYFKIAGEEQQQLQIQIYSVTGQLLLSTYKDANDNVDVSTLPSGMYFVKVNGQTIKMCKK